MVPAECVSDPHAEQCLALVGWVIADGTYVVAEMIPVPNVAKDPANDFAVRRSSIERIEQFGLNVIGVLHTHLAHHGPEPTDGDYDGIIEGWLGGVYKDGHISWYTKEPLAAVSS